MCGCKLSCARDGNVSSVLGCCGKPLPLLLLGGPEKAPSSGLHIAKGEAYGGIAAVDR